MVMTGLRIVPPEFMLYPPGLSNSTSQSEPRVVSNCKSTFIERVASPLWMSCNGTGVMAPGAMNSTDRSSECFRETPNSCMDNVS